MEKTAGKNFLEKVFLGDSEEKESLKKKIIQILEFPKNTIHKKSLERYVKSAGKMAMEKSHWNRIKLNRFRE